MRCEGRVQSASVVCHEARGRLVSLLFEHCRERPHSAIFLRLEHGILTANKVPITMFSTTEDTQ